MNVECKLTQKGVEYRGMQNITPLGRTCQRWDMQTPHKHPYTDPALYGEIFLSDGWNYCRNPDRDSTLWCYTTDPNVRYEYCTHIHFCGN